MAMMIVVLSVVAMRRVSIEFFREVTIPVVALVGMYPGVSPDDMEKRAGTLSSLEGHESLISNHGDLLPEGVR